MRTTLDIDPEILDAVKEIAARESSTAGRVLSELARRGLSSNRSARAGSKTRNGVPLLPTRDEIVTSEKVRRLLEED